MMWYDRIAPFYDAFTTRFYRQPRQVLLEAMGLQPSDRVLVWACGTGQSFPYLEEKIGPQGEIVAVDASAGMLARARRRVARHGWQSIRLLQADVRDVDAGFFQARGIDPRFDAVLGELAFSVIPAWERVLDVSYTLLKPGGRLGLLDWYRPRHDALTRVVDWLAAAETNRDVLGAVAARFGRVEVKAKYFFGSVYVTVAEKVSLPE